MGVHIKSAILKTGLLLYLVHIILPTVRAGCSDHYDYELCVFKMLCTNDFVLQNSWYHFQSDEVIRNEFQCSATIHYRNNNMNPIYLTVQKSVADSDEGVPGRNYDDNYDIVLGSVTEMDLSGNNYYFYPTIRRMNNLVKVNMSNNGFHTASLSNKNELPSLREIDLSHNYISQVQINHADYLFEKLEKINLSYNSLVQVPETIFDSFVNLTNLDLSHNSIDILGPITFEGMKKLVNLNMSYNSISDINASLFRFSELKTLDLRNNKLNTLKASDVNMLTKLTTLNLKSNFITRIESDAFESLRALNSLDISDNALENLYKDTFKNVDNLKQIIISNNKFKTLPKGLFKGKTIELFSVVDNYLEGSIERGTFEGLQLVLGMDLSNQRLDLIGDNAFYGMDKLKVLLLQNNNIKTLSSKCFNMLQRLVQLDLSYNKIKNIDFEKDSLGNLESLSIRNNDLSVVKQEHFKGLDSLQILDLSDNKITQLESNSFESLKNLISFEISNNPLNGTLEANTFDGLTSLPILDISCTLLNAIQNGSFNGMTQLKTLNISRSEIQTLEYNSFNHTGFVETLDLSHNKITEFKINNTHLSKLYMLYLNNNHIKTLDSQTFDKMISLTNIILSYNEIENIHISTFVNQIDLRVLDVSYNPNLIFSYSYINSTHKLDELFISGNKAGMSFGNVRDVSLRYVAIANANVVDVKALQLNDLTHLNNLILSHNKISKLEVGCLTNISTLEQLDLSFNSITYIQPGALKDNSLLHSLNISHNQLKTLAYGIFRGLINLHTLDISYNSIETLENERFYEVRSLSVLIADHNKIGSLNVNEFIGTTLTILSIGDNPIPCKELANLKKNERSFNITGIKFDVTNDENIKGIICNKNKGLSNMIPVSSPIDSDNANVLINIRDVLLNKFNNEDREDTRNKKEEDLLVNIANHLSNISSNLSKMYNATGDKKSNLANITAQIINSNNNTNTLVEKILKLLTLNSLKRPTTPVPISKDNATYDNLLNYINKLKQQFDDTIIYEKNNILNEVEAKISAINSRFSSVKSNPGLEKLSAIQADPKSVFNDTCIALILLILICLVMFKIYKSRLFRRKRLSISTRELPDAMDSAL